MPSSDQDILTLRDGHALCTIAPAAGGRLMQWRIAEHDILHWPDDADLTRAAKVRGGNPLLFPFIGRHRVGDEANRWQDAEGHIYALSQHGFARDLPFAVLEKTERSVTLRLAPSAATRDGYPFDFTFDVHYTLDGNALDVEFRTSNHGTQPMPYYAGHHFYFHLPQVMRNSSRLHLPPTQRCEQAPDGSISPRLSEPDDYVPGDPAIQDKFHVLNSNTAHNESPVATLDIPALGRRIAIDLRHAESNAFAPWYAITTWTESDQSDFYCVEPWLGLPNAIHHGLGLRWVAPNEIDVAHCRLYVSFDAV